MEEGGYGYNKVEVIKTILDSPLTLGQDACCEHRFSQNLLQVSYIGLTNYSRFSRFSKLLVGLFYFLAMCSKHRVENFMFEVISTLLVHLKVSLQPSLPPRSQPVTSSTPYSLKLNPSTCSKILKLFRLSTNRRPCKLMSCVYTKRYKTFTFVYINGVLHSLYSTYLLTQ